MKQVLNVKMVGLKDLPIDKFFLKLNLKKYQTVKAN
tara:strand:- start:227 stop:334 length:108 start_codon:yes stop_codon:yes gene_type:complete